MLYAPLAHRLHVYPTETLTQIPTNTHVMNAGQGTYAIMHTAESSKVLVWPPYEDTPVHISLRHGKITAIKIHAEDAHLADVTSTVIYPARHHVTTEDELQRACKDIEAELEQRLAQLEAEGNAVAAQRSVCLDLCEWICVSFVWMCMF
jgi:excinuclease UvrABC helicase subunit UvrB